ncbi:hypothetical protein [Sphingomonas sp. S2-65]|uniref:hypothetical protein n=1 Tax=Sphingomonas sp. S2-65 TaxID=2903960 RepID=UPI001F24AB12|nr:hypothetical protein [Sphingomonas sp. S2-65]UYY57103.1 hypothetical protein LZ586_10425 [Sphingomonas sp. S2-65]
MPDPNHAASYEDKFELVRKLVVQTADGLAEKAPGRKLTADDMVDVWAMALGALVANDSNLKTPRDFRLTAETVAAHINKHAKEFRKLQDEEGGASTFQLFLASAQLERPARGSSSH